MKRYPNDRPFRHPTGPRRRVSAGVRLAGALALATVVGFGLGLIADTEPSRATSKATLPPPTRSLDHARGVLYRHRAELIERYDAVGVGVRRRSLDDARAVLVVYLPASIGGAADETTPEPTVDGVPLIFEIIGRTALRENRPAASP